MMKKYRLLIIALFISTFLSAQTGTPDYTWYSGKVSPYSLSSTDQLLAFSNIVNGTAGETINNGNADNFASKIITLTTDLDLSNYRYPDGATGWTAIGNNENHPFTGSFDGQNHTIRNLVSYLSNDTLVGLFGYVRNGKIGQLMLADVNIQTATYVQSAHAAGLVACLEAAADSAIVEHCSVTGIIRATSYCENGGLISRINSNGVVIVRNCTSSANLQDGVICGMIGHIFDDNSVIVRNCENNGTISSNIQGSFCGGIIGLITNYYSKECIISNCTNTGEVSNLNSGGGVIGYVDGGPVNIDHCANTAKIFKGNYTGGIIGFTRGITTISSSYNSGLISGTTYSGGIIGIINSHCTITNSYNTGDVIVSGSAGGTGGGITGWISATWYDTTAIKNCYNTGSIVGEMSGDAGGIAGFGYVNNYGYITISNCVSLGCSLSGYLTGAGRIMGGFDGEVQLMNNYGWLLTNVNCYKVSDSNTNGTGISSAQGMTASNWWNGTTGYFSTVDKPAIKPDQVWEFRDNLLPVLQSMPGQLNNWGVCTFFTVSFNTNGGSEIASEEVSIPAKAVKPAIPVRPGYTFIDWYSDQFLNTIFDFNTLITQDITLYAKWEKIMYVVSFNSLGGSIIADEKVAMYDKAIKPANPTQPGYSFVNWYMDQSLSYIFDFESLITNNTTLYAKWEIIPIVLNTEKITSGYSCTNKYAFITYGVKTGLAKGYKIVFDSKAITAGFKNIDYFPSLRADSTIIIPVPISAPAGRYVVTLFIRGLGENVSPGYPVIISKMLSEDVILGKFTNLVFCDNSQNNFIGYQWYKNGVPIANADKQYYDDGAGRAGNSYQVKVVTSARDTLMSCPKTFLKSQIAGVTLKLYPNPLFPGGIGNLEVEGLSANDYYGAILTIYNSHGIAVYQAKDVSGSNKIYLPDIEGLYICELMTSSGASYSCKILMNR